MPPKAPKARSRQAARFEELLKPTSGGCRALEAVLPKLSTPIKVCNASCKVRSWHVKGGGSQRPVAFGEGCRVWHAFGVGAASLFGIARAVGFGGFKI